MYFAVLEFTDLGSSNPQAVDAARSQLLEAIASAETATVEVKLQAQTIGASFVGVIAEAAKCAKTEGKHLVIHSVNPKTAKVLRLCDYEHLSR